MTTLDLAGQKFGRRYGCPNRETTRRFYTKHGMSRTPEVRAYTDGRGRCRNSKHGAYSRYGQRGIEFRFGNFEEFFAALGPRPSPQHSLDRRDNDGPYSPTNCQWSTAVEQANNKRTTRLIALEGRTMSLTLWSREKRMPASTVTARIDRLNWSAARALTEPVRSGGKLMKDYARELGLAPSALSARLKRGWPLERANSTPRVRQRKRAA